MTQTSPPRQPNRQRPRHRVRSLARPASMPLLNLEGLERRALQAVITEFPIPNSQGAPFEIAPGPDGNLWFTDTKGAIGKITPSGTTTEYPIPTNDGSPWGIAAGSDGNLWFTENKGNKIGKITPSGVITEYALPTSDSQPQGIVQGSDGAMWFTETNIGKIGRIGTSGVITQFALPGNSSKPYDIVSGPGGALWFTENNTGDVGKLTTSGSLTEYIPPTNNGKPTSITYGPDGNLWLIESSANTVTKLSPSGAYTDYPLTVSGGAKLGDITTGPDGNLWYTEYGSGVPQNLIGRLTTSGVETQYQIPSKKAGPMGITTGPDNRLWFAESSDAQIGALASSANPSATLIVANHSSISYGDSLSLSAGVLGSPTNPSGTITFLDGTTVLATVPLDGNDVATYLVPFLSVGNHTISARYNGDNVYAGSTSVSFTETVSPATLTVNANSLSKTYGATVPALTYSYAGLVNGDTSAVFTGALTTSATASSNAGAYNIKQGTLSAGPNYNIVYNKGTLNVNRASLTVNANSVSISYGAAFPPFTYTYSGLVNGDTSAVFTGALSTNATSSSNPGAYDINQGTLSAGPNYAVTYNKGTLNINQGSIVITADSLTDVYGSTLPTLTYTYTGGNNVPFTGSLATLATATSPTGTYEVDLGTLSAGAGYSISFNPGSLKITPATLDVAADSLSKVYGDAVPLLTYTYNGLVNGDTNDVFTGALSTTLTADDPVGAYGVSLGSLSAGSNYSIHYVRGTITVTPATLNIQADALSKVYGDAVPPLTFQAGGFVGSDDDSLLTGALATSATASSNVGSYDIDQGTLDAGPNYSIQYAPSKLNVTPATLVVTANHLTKVVGTPMPTLTYTVSGLVNNDTEGVLSGALSTPARRSSPAGDYPIDQGTLSTTPNYALTFVPGTLSVVVAGVAGSTTTLSTSSVSSTYGQALTFTADVSGSQGMPIGTVSFYSGTRRLGTVSLNDGVASFTTTALGAGSDSITAAFNGDPVYAASTSTAIDESVAKAVINVSAVNLTKVYGASLPPFVIAYSGLVNGDTSAVFTGTLADDADASSGVGAYAIRQGTLSAGANYTINFNPGSISVTPAVLRIDAANASKLYGASLPGLTYSQTGLVNGDTSAVLSGSLGTSASSRSGVGRYAITQGTLSAGANYTIQFNPGTLTVNPAVLNVSANSVVKPYGAALPAMTYSLTGLVNGDAAGVLTGIPTTSATSSSHVGNYGITQGSLGVGPNYQIHFTPATLSVTPVVLDIFVVDSSRSYEASNPSFRAVASGLVGGDSLAKLGGSLIFRTEATVSSLPGTYEVLASGLTSTDYELQYINGLLTVDPLTLNVDGEMIAAKASVPFSGEVATFSSSASILNPAGYSATIDWGDGNQSSGTIGFDPVRGVYTVSGLNTYLSDGVHAIRIVISGPVESTATGNGLAVVAAIPWTLKAESFQPAPGLAVSGDLAMILESKTPTETLRFSARINWGDGTSSSAVFQTFNGGLILSGAHTYANPGTYQTVVSVVDQDGVRASTVVSVQVVEAAVPVPPKVVPVHPAAATPAPVVVPAPAAITVMHNDFTTANVDASTVRPLTATLPSRGTLQANASPGQSVVSNASMPSRGNPSSPVINVSTAGLDNSGANGGADRAGDNAVVQAVQAALSFASKRFASLLEAIGRAGATRDLRSAWAAREAVVASPLLADLAAMPRVLSEELDHLEEDLSQNGIPSRAVGLAGTGAIACVGYVLLNSRGGLLLLSMLAAKPMWSQADPLAVLLEWEKEQKRKSPDDEETLQSLIEKSRGDEPDVDDEPNVAPKPRAGELNGRPPLRRPHGRTSSRPRNRSARKA